MPNASASFGEVRSGQVGRVVVARVDDLLPLPDHPELLVVEQRDLDRDVVGDEGHQLLERHLEAAVAGDRPGLAVGPAERRAHRRRHGEAHRPEAARADVAVRVAEARVAGQPHLVLADVGDVGRLVVGQLADPLDDVVGRQQPVAPGARAVPARGDRVGLPLGELGEVVGPRRRVDRIDEPGQRLQDALGVADDRHLDRDVLADLGRVDVGVDDPGVRRVGPDVAGHPVVEAHPDGDQQVGALDRPVDVLPAVHPHVAVGQRMRLVDDADPEQRPGDRDLGLLGERDEVVPGLGVEDAVAGQDDRALGGGDLGGGELELARMAVHVRPEAGQPGDDLGLGRVGRARLLLEGVLGDVDVDRARAGRSGRCGTPRRRRAAGRRRRGRGSCAWSSAG